MVHKIKVLGHRGAMKEGFYENTLNGFAAALQHSDGLEVDAVRTADDVVFLVHETDASGGTVHYELTRHLSPESCAVIGNKRTDQLDAEQLTKLRLQNGEPLPKLTALLALTQQHPKALLNIELKAHHTAAVVANTLQASGINPQQVFVSSFNHAELARFRQLAPQYKIGALFDGGHAQRLPMFPWLNTDQDAFYEPYSPAALEKLRALQPDYIGLNCRDLSAATITAIADTLPQAQTYIWWNIVNDLPPAETPESFFNLLASLNAEKSHILALITNHPQKMAKVLTSRGLR